jgi:hypothetical protein
LRKKTKADLETLCVFNEGDEEPADGGQSIIERFFSGCERLAASSPACTGELAKKFSNMPRGTRPISSRSQLRSAQVAIPS